MTTINNNVTGSGPNQWQYTGTNWIYYNDGGNKYNGDDHSSSAAGDVATLRFSGTKAEYYGARSPQAGIVAISVNNGAETMVDLYSATRYDNVLLFSTPTLSEGNHELRIRLTGTKNAAATDDAAAVDRAVVYTGTPNPIPSAEAEHGTLTNGAATVDDSSASAGRSVAFRAPAGGGGSAPMPYPTRAVALYHMMWSTSGSPKLSTTPANVNVINMSFAQNDPPALTGWGSQGESSFIADATALRQRGVRMVVSVGGAHGHVNLANRQSFVNGIMAINAKLPLDGLDWDLEGSTPMAPADVVWISKELKRLRGPNFAITMAPNGSNIDHYRNIAVQPHQNNALDMIGQQFYDAVVSQGAMMGRLGQLRAAGIPENKMAVGMMVGSADTYWTVEECLANYQAAKNKYPNIRGGYLWEASRAGTADWANRVGNLIKQ